MKLTKRLLGGLMAAVMTISSFAAVTQAASNTDGAYNVGNGILISSTDMSADGIITLASKNVQYDTGSSKKGTAVFTDDGDVKTQRVIDIFGASYAYDGVIDYVGSGKDKNTLVVPVNITAEGNYFVFVLARAAGQINMWTDNASATIKAGTTGAKQPMFAVTGTNGVAYAVDCGTLSAGKHTFTLDGAAGAWCPDICAVSVYPMSGGAFKLPYQNETLSFEERAADLVSRMTTEQKISQLGHGAPAIPELGVSAYNYWREGAHGVARQGKATSFPSSIAMSNTWDVDLYEQAAEITANEARAKNPQYNLNYWSPTINMSRDPRWGRNEESLGEDTLLTSELGGAFVRGMQGEGDGEKYIKTIATVKHFLANNCEAERQTGTSVMSESDLKNYYAKAFGNIVEQTNPGAVMSSYNATTVTRGDETLWDYIVMPANDNLLTESLRRSWGFTGFVTGDCGAVANLDKNEFKRKLFDSYGDTRELANIARSETIAASVKAGNEMDCGSVSQQYAAEAVESGALSVDELDRAVYRIFLQRFKTGEFDNTDVYRTYTDLETDESVAVAEKAAEESIVLLENSEDAEHNKLLPIDKTANKKIALVGNMAGETYLGDYSGSPNKTVSPYEGIKAEFGANNVSFLGQPEAGSAIMNINSLTFLDKNMNTVKTIDLSGATVTGGTLSGGKITGATSALSVEVANVDFDKVVNVRANIEVPSGSVGGILNVGYDSPTLVVSTVKTANSAASATDYTADYTGADGGYNGKGKTLYLTITPYSDFTYDKYSSYEQQLSDADIIIAYSSTMATGDKDSDGERTDCKESNDRTSIKLPKRDRDIIEKICDDFGSKTVVVSQSAGEMDFTAIRDKCRAILWTGYNGQKQGEALAKILSGTVNPSGKLSTTWYAPEDLTKMPVGSGGKSETAYDTNGTTRITYTKADYSLAQKKDGDTLVWPGRTYMYYGNAPQYPFGYGLGYSEYEYSNLRLDNASVSGGDKITVSVDVLNKGDKAGREVVQIYMKHSTADGVNLPLRQLVGFKPVELDANEKKTVQIEVDTSTLSRWSEDDLKNYIPQGAYTLYAGKNSLDNALTADVTIMGNPARKIKTIYAVPSGIKVTGAYDKTANKTAPITTIDPSVSVYMTDETPYELTDGDITYTSSNNNIAAVNEDGQIVAGTEEGVALITASVTVNGETKTTAFPVVTKLQAAISTEERAEYLSRLDTEYAKYTESDYRQDFWTQLTEIDETAKEKIQSEPDSAKLNKYLTDASGAMAAIRDHLKPNEKAYTVTFKENLYYWNAQADIVYNGDEDNPSAKLITAVYGADKALKSIAIRDCAANMTVSDSISLDKLSENDIVRCYVWDSTESMTPLADAKSTTIVKPPKTVVYDLSEAKYDALSTLAAGDELQPVNGIGGYAKMTRITDVSYNVTYNGTQYNLTGGFQGGKGSFSNSCVYFKPFDCYSKARITVFFDSSSSDRMMRIAQNDGTKNGIELGTMGGNGNRNIQTLTVTTDDLTKDIYIQPQTKESFYKIIVEYDYE